MALSRKKYQEACAARWYAWRAAGHSPKTRNDALVLITEELAAAGCQVALASIQKMARSLMAEDGS